MAVITEVFEGQFNLTESGVQDLITSLEKLDKIADRIGKSLAGITFKPTQINVSKVFDAQVIDKAVATVNTSLKKIDVTVQSTVNLAGKSFQQMSETIRSQLARLPDKTAPEFFKLKDQFARLQKDFRSKDVDVSAGAIEGMRRLSQEIEGASVAQAKLKAETQATQKALRSQADAVIVGDKLRTLQTEFENVRKTSNLTTVSLQDRFNGLRLAFSDTGSSLQGLREIFAGTNKSTNLFVQTLDGLIRQRDPITGLSTELTRSISTIARSTDDSIRSLQSQQAVLKRTFTKEVGEGVGAFERFNEQLTKTNAAIKQVEVTALAGGNIANGIIRARVEVEGLKTQYTLLKQQGILPSGSASDVMFQNMIAQAESVRDRLQAMAGRYENVKQKIAAARAEQDRQNTSGEKQVSIFGRISINLKNMFNVFSGGRKEIVQTTQTLQTFDNKLQDVANSSNVLKGAFLGSFGGTFLANLTSNFLNVLGQVQGQFFSLNNTIQNTNITISGMLEGSTVNAKKAIAGFTEFIEGEVAKTPFEYADAIDTALRLTQQGFDPQLWFRPAANAAAAMNKPMEQFTGGMTKLISGARGAAVDMFRDFGLNVNNIAGYFDKATGRALTFAEVQEMTAKGTLDNAEKMSFEFDKQGSLIGDTGDLLNILNAYLNQNATFAKAAEARSHSLTGVISNLKDAFSKILIAVGQPIFERITAQATSLLGIVDKLSPTLTVFASNLGFLIGQGIDNLVLAFQNAQQTVNNFFTTFQSIFSLFTSVIAGDWPAAWTTFQAILIDAIDNSLNILGDFASQMFDWGANIVVELANGIMDTASDLITQAMDYIGELMGGFLAPGSPPEEGPLSEIDTWGQGIMQTFTDSMSKVDTTGIENALGQIKDAFNQFDLSSASADVFAIQQQINAAEAAGFVPAELKKQLALAKDKVSLIQSNLQLQQQLNQEQKKEPEKKEAKAKGGRGAAGGAKDRAGVEKKTALQIKDDALKILDQQLKDGVISYEDYAKDRLKIEQKFYEDTMEEGGKATNENIKNIKFYQDEVDRITEETKKKQKKEDGRGAPFTPPTVAEIFGRFEEQAEEVGEKVGEKFVAAIKVSTTKNITTLKDTFIQNFNKIRDSIFKSLTGKGLDPKLLAGILGVTKLATTFTNVGKVLDKIVPGLKFLPGIFTGILSRLGPLGAIIARLTGLALRFAGPVGLIVTIFLNWDTIVGTITGTLAYFNEVVDELSKRLGGPIATVRTFNKAINQTRGIFAQIGRAVTTFIDQIGTEGFTAAIQNLFVNLGNIDTGALFEALGKIFSGLGEALVAALPKSITDFFKQIPELIRPAVEAFQGFFSQGRLGGELLNLFAQLKELFIANLPVAKMIGTVLLVIAGIIANVLVSALQALVSAGPFIEAALTGVVTVITGVVDVLTGVVTGFQAIFALLTGDTDKATTLMLQAWTNIRDGIGNILRGLLQTVMGIVGSLLAFAVSFVGNFIANILQFIPGWENAATIVRNITNEMISIMTGLLTSATEILVGLSNQISILISAGFQAALATLAQFILDVIAYFQNLYTELVGESIVVDIVEGIINLFISLQEKGIAAIAEFITAAVKKFGELRGKFIDLGKKAIEGLIEGFKKKRDAVIDYLSDLALEALEAVGLGWAIKSPSIRFMELGVQAIEGLNEGLNSTPITIAKIADDAADKAETLMKKTITGSKARNIGDRIRRFFEQNYGQIIAGQIDATKELRDLILDKDVFRALGIGKTQQGAVGRAITRAVEQFQKTNQAAKDIFAAGQAKLFANIQKSVAETSEKFNQQFFNITNSATEARIELDKLFNRTVTDAEVERMAKAFEGVPVEQLSEQQKLILRNYVLQKKTAQAVQEQAKVQQAITRFAELGKLMEQFSTPTPAATDKATQAGNALIEALGLGIDAGVEDVLNSLNSVTAQIIDKLKANFGIASPSTVAMGFGQNFSFGLAEGILSGLSTVDRAVGTLSGSLNPNMLLATGGGALNLGRADLQASAGGPSIQLVQYNTINDEFDMAIFTARVEQSVIQALRRG